MLVDVQTSRDLENCLETRPRGIRSSPCRLILPRSLLPSLTDLRVIVIDWRVVL